MTGTLRDDTAQMVAWLREQEARMRHMILWNFLDLRDAHETHRLGVASDEDIHRAHRVRHREGWQESWRPD